MRERDVVPVFPFSIMWTKMWGLDRMAGVSVFNQPSFLFQGIPCCLYSGHIDESDGVVQVCVFYLVLRGLQAVGELFVDCILGCWNLLTKFEDTTADIGKMGALLCRRRYDH